MKQQEIRNVLEKWEYCINNFPYRKIYEEFRQDCLKELIELQLKEFSK